MHTITTLFLAVMLSALVQAASSKTIFVAPSGNDQARGTLTDPLATLPGAYRMVAPGDTVYFRGGTYHVTDGQIMKNMRFMAYVFALEKGGTEQGRTCFMGYPGERPVFDFSALQLDGRTRFGAFYLGADYLHLRNFDIVGVPVRVKGHTQSECVSARKGSHCIVENIAMHDGMAIGYYQTTGSHNLVLNCDAYNNYDNYSEGFYGGNTDGFGFHLELPDCVGNAIRNCRAWRNSDDGFDLIHCAAPVEIDHCWAFYNGYQSAADPHDIHTFERAGDGNGFKSGGWGMRSHAYNCPSPVPVHHIHDCVAFHNKANGFYANHHLGGNVWERNVAADNQRDNFNMVNRQGRSMAECVDVPGYGHVLTGNVSWRPNKVHLSHCNLKKCMLCDNQFGVDNADSLLFASVNPSDVFAPRNAEGYLPDMPYLQVKPRKSELSALDPTHFDRYWKVESESDDFRVSFEGDTCEIVAPKGLTLWRKEKMKAGATVEYDALVTGDRLSDMNFFWMASDPKAKTIWKRSQWRKGIFNRCYTLQMYYLGYGGNSNRTTRFRRYQGNEEAVADKAQRPAIVKEYTDAAHLLRPAHWYHVKITGEKGHVRVFVDGECIVDYTDAAPLESGWFGFRTTHSRVKITRFKAY